MQGVPNLWQTPFSASERSMSRSLTGEWMFTRSMFGQVLAGGDPGVIVADAWQDADAGLYRLIWRVLRPLLQIQDSLNRHAELLEAIAETLDVPYSKYPDALEAAGALERQVRDSAIVPARAYNLIGAIVSAISVSQFSSYAPRVADLEGVRRSALLATKLRSRKVAPPQVSRLLCEAQEKNPYNGKPFRWDAQRNAVVFGGLEPGERGRHLMLY